MPKITVEIDNENAAKLEGLKEKGENLQRMCERILMDLADAPRPEKGVSGYRAMMVPAWFHRLGTCYDRELAVEVYGEEKWKSNIPRISNIRSAIDLRSFRRQGRPRKFTPEERMKNWEILKKGSFNSTAIITALGFRNTAEAIAWAENHDLPDLIEYLTSRRQKKAV